MTIKYYCPVCHRYWVDDAHPYILPYKAGGFHYVDKDGIETKTCPSCVSPYWKGHWKIYQKQPKPRIIPLHQIPESPTHIHYPSPPIQRIYKETNYISSHVRY